MFSFYFEGREYECEAGILFRRILLIVESFDFIFIVLAF